MELQQIQSVQLHNNSVVIPLETYNELILKAKIVDENISYIPSENRYIDDAKIMTNGDAVKELSRRLIKCKRGRIDLDKRITEVSNTNTFLQNRIEYFESKEETDQAISDAKEWTARNFMSVSGWFMAGKKAGDK